MAILKLPDNGQETQIPDEVARDDALLKQALAIVYPGAANMEIKREERDGQLIVTIIKKAGTKGNFQEVLEAAPEEINPAIVLLAELKEKERSGSLDITDMVLLQGRISQAIDEGHAEEARLETAQRILKLSAAEIPPEVPVGF